MCGVCRWSTLKISNNIVIIYDSKADCNFHEIKWIFNLCLTSGCCILFGQQHCTVVSYFENGRICLVQIRAEIRIKFEANQQVGWTNVQLHNLIWKSNRIECAIKEKCFNYIHWHLCSIDFDWFSAQFPFHGIGFMRDFQCSFYNFSVLFTMHLKRKLAQMHWIEYFESIRLISLENRLFWIDSLIFLTIFVFIDIAKLCILWIRERDRTTYDGWKKSKHFCWS